MRFRPLLLTLTLLQADAVAAASLQGTVVALGTTRRFGSTLLAASRKVAGSLPRSGAIPTEAWQAFRSPTSLAKTSGRVDVLTFDTPRAEADHIADALRRARQMGDDTGSFPRLSKCAEWSWAG